MEMKEERPLIRYEKLSKEDLVDYCRVYWRRIHNDEVLFNEIYKDIEKLKKENKKLKKENKMLIEDLSSDKELQQQIAQKQRDYYEENRKLNEKVRFLEECLDRKEKLNEEYRKEIEELKSTYVYDAKQVRDVC